jgi:hypothetical protein
MSNCYVRGSMLDFLSHGKADMNSLLITVLFNDLYLTDG